MGNKTVTINLENLSEEQHTQLMKLVELAKEPVAKGSELQDYALEHNEGEIDWENGLQRKYSIAYDFLKEDTVIICHLMNKRNDAYFTSPEIARAAIASIGEDRLKKYYFEVGE